MLVAGTAPMFVPARVFGAESPSNRVTLGFIGVGFHGRRVNLTSLLSEPDSHVLAVCDCKRSKALEAAGDVNERYGNQDCDIIDDFRELIARDDIDGIVISTPDHWHVPMSLMGLEAGKHVFSEKPTLTIEEGRRLANAFAKADTVFATGLEDRSLIHYHKMAEAVRNGAIGELQHIHVSLPKKPIFPIEQPAPVPADFNYKLWLGPAPYRPYTENLTHPQVWRQIRDFSGGSLTDWGMHLVDTAQVGNFSELTTPVKVKGVGHLPMGSVNTVAHTYDLDYTYANGVTMKVVAGDVAIKFEGTQGWVGNNGWRGKLEASDMEVYRRTYDEATNKMWPRPRTEHRNFLDAIRHGAEPIYDAESLHQLSAALHMGNISMELGRELNYDPSTETFDDSAANALRSRVSHTDWAS